MRTGNRLTTRKHITKRQRTFRLPDLAPYRIRTCYPKVQFGMKEDAEDVRVAMEAQGKDAIKGGVLHTYLCPDCGYEFWHIGHTD